MKKSQKVLFFGSGPVAASSLELLAANPAFEIEAVITKPNPPHHRGTAPVIELCKSTDLALHTPDGKAALTDFFTNAKFESRIGIVIDYGIIIEQSVIDYFPLGIINSHFSLLPQWRGADPITFSLLSGQTHTGVSLMRINDKLDEGAILADREIAIEALDNSITLTQKLINLSNEMLDEFLPAYTDGSLKVYEQEGTPTYSRKLTKADGVIDWHKPAAQIEREIRAFYEWPKSRGIIGQQELIIRQASFVAETGTPGSYNITKKELIVFCGEDALKIERVQPLNKKEMPIEAFLLGYKL